MLRVAGGFLGNGIPVCEILRGVCCPFNVSCVLSLLLGRLVKTFLRQFAPFLKTHAQNRFIIAGINQENVWIERVKQAKALMGKNIYGNISLNEICKNVMLNKSTSERAFRRYEHAGVIGYYRKLKIEKATEPPREGNMNITQTAERLGFSSLHYFSLTFRQLTGMSPGEYVRSIKSIIDKSKSAAEQR